MSIIKQKNGTQVMTYDMKRSNRHYKDSKTWNALCIHQIDHTAPSPINYWIIHVPSCFYQMSPSLIGFKKIIFELPRTCVFDHFKHKSVQFSRASREFSHLYTIFHCLPGYWRDISSFNSKVESPPPQSTSD